MERDVPAARQAAIGKYTILHCNQAAIHEAVGAQVEGYFFSDLENKVPSRPAQHVARCAM